MLVVLDLIDAQVCRDECGATRGEEINYCGLHMNHLLLSRKRLQVHLPHCQAWASTPAPGSYCNAAL